MIDMLRLLPQYTPDEFDSRHRLAIVAAQRAKHILQGSRHGASRFTKETTIALMKSSGDKSNTSSAKKRRMR